MSKENLTEVANKLRSIADSLEGYSSEEEAEDPSMEIMPESNADKISTAAAAIRTKMKK